MIFHTFVIVFAYKIRYFKATKKNDIIVFKPIKIGKKCKILQYKLLYFLSSFCSFFQNLFRNLEKDFKKIFKIP
jgi:hypothetical protein